MRWHSSPRRRPSSRCALKRVRWQTSHSSQALGVPYGSHPPSYCTSTGQQQQREVRAEAVLEGGERSGGTAKEEQEQGIEGEMESQ